MAQSKESSICRILSSLFSQKWIEKTSREVGFVQRSRKVDAVAFFWTLVLGFGAGNGRTFAALRRCYEAETGVSLVPSAFYDRFTEKLVKLFRAAMLHLIKRMGEPTRRLRGRLAVFSDLVVFDSTLFKLHDLLASVFPGTRQHSSKATGKLHLVMSVLSCGPRHIRIAGERARETKLMRLGPWVKGRLLLFDLGYFRYLAFARIAESGGYFISRLRADIDPVITQSLQSKRGRASKIEGRHLREVLSCHRKEDILDAETEIAFKRRSYSGHQRHDQITLRVVAVRNKETGEYHVYLTNVPPEKLTARDVARTYGGRWEIELVFRQLKSQLRLADLPTAKKHAMEALLLASLISLFVCRRFLWELRKNHPNLAERMPSERWAAIFVQFAIPILHAILEERRKPDYRKPDLLNLMRMEAIDPNLSRIGGLLGRVETGYDARYETMSGA